MDPPDRKKTLESNASEKSPTKVSPIVSSPPKKKLKSQGDNQGRSKTQVRPTTLPFQSPASNVATTPTTAIAAGVGQLKLLPPTGAPNKCVSNNIVCPADYTNKYDVELDETSIQECSPTWLVNSINHPRLDELLKKDLINFTNIDGLNHIEIDTLAEIILKQATHPKQRFIYVPCRTNNLLVDYISEEKMQKLYESEDDMSWEKVKDFCTRYVPEKINEDRSHQNLPTQNDNDILNSLLPCFTPQANGPTTLIHMTGNVTHVTLVSANWDDKSKNLNVTVYDTEDWQQLRTPGTPERRQMFLTKVIISACLKRHENFNSIPDYTKIVFSGCGCIMRDFHRWCQCLNSECAIIALLCLVGLAIPDSQVEKLSHMLLEFSGRLLLFYMCDTGRFNANLEQVRSSNSMSKHRTIVRFHLSRLSKCLAQEKERRLLNMIVRYAHTTESFKNLNPGEIDQSVDAKKIYNGIAHRLVNGEFLTSMEDCILMLNMQAEVASREFQKFLLSFKIQFLEQKGVNEVKTTKIVYINSRDLPSAAPAPAPTATQKSGKTPQKDDSRLSSMELQGADEYNGDMSTKVTPIWDPELKMLSIIIRYVNFQYNESKKHTTFKFELLLITSLSLTDYQVKQMAWRCIQEFYPDQSHQVNVVKLPQPQEGSSIFFSDVNKSRRYSNMQVMMASHVLKNLTTFKKFENDQNATSTWPVFQFDRLSLLSSLGHSAYDYSVIELVASLHEFLFPPPVFNSRNTIHHTCAI